jgi:manganese/zinc/iron transport system ATP- binding protein
MEAPGQAAIDVVNLTVSYLQRVALRGITLAVKPGQVVGIVGPNGAGKSTLLKATMGLLPLDSGRVFVFGQPVARVRRAIAYVPQREAVDWDYPVVVEDVVMMGRYPHLGWLRRAGRGDREIAQRSLTQVEMDGLRGRQIGQLSGGQQQRVFLARALAQEASVYLLDEPFVGVDAATERAIVSLLS